MRNQLVSTDSTELLFQFQHNEPILHPQWQYSSEPENLFSSWLKRPKWFCHSYPRWLWSSVRCFGTYLTLFWLKPRFSRKIWCADSLLMLNWLASSCNVTLRFLLTKKSPFPTIVGVTASAGLSGLELSFTLALPSLNCKTSLNGICRL